MNLGSRLGAVEKRMKNLTTGENSGPNCRTCGMDRLKGTNNRFAWFRVVGMVVEALGGQDEEERQTSTKREVQRFCCEVCGAAKVEGSLAVWLSPGQAHSEVTAAGEPAWWKF